MRRICLAVLPLLAAVLAPGRAAACPCQEFCGKVVAHGSSPYGVPWRITAATRSGPAAGTAAAELHFSVHACGEHGGAGYFSSLSLPLPRAEFFHATTGTEIDPYPEGDLSGFTSRRVVRLALKMSDGTTLTARPRLAPRGLRHSLPWLRRLRLFDRFFPAGRVPVEVGAYDHAGRFLGSARSQRGMFTFSSRR